MCKILGFVVLLVLINASYSKEDHSIVPRVLPTNENCDPDNQVCRKGDWIATWVADCERDGFSTCDARNDVWFSWTVDVAEDDYCNPVSSKRFRCGAAGTNTRCVCSDYKVQFNECRCQYWPPEDPGTNLPAFCTAYYTGGSSGVHHWACCNNCDDSDTTCSGQTWQGGSSGDYCSPCGQNNAAGGGRVKYYFNCGNCDQQRECENSCNGIIQSSPGFCWKWVDCFKGCCLRRARQPPRSKRQGNNTAMSFCGDGTCGEGETPTSCPTDCCYKVNSMCDNSNENICHLDCCGSSSCCLESESKAPNLQTSLIPVLLALVTAVFFP